MATSLKKLTALLIPLLLIGCFKTSRNSDQLIIISPHEKQIKDEFTEAFRNYMKREFGRNVTIEWLDQGGTTDDQRFVASEFKRSPGTINVDLFWGGGITPHLLMKSAGYLQRIPLSSEALKGIPSTAGGVELFDQEGFWYGTALSSFGLLYNREILRLRKLPVPTSWEDVGRPEFANWFVTADPRHSGSVHMAFSIILQALGWEKGWEVIIKMGGNAKQFARKSSDVLKWVGSGDAAVGMAIDFYATAKILELGSDKLGFVLPKNETMLNPDAISLLKGAPHKELATKFIEYVLSPEGQSLWMLPSGQPGGPSKSTLARMSVRPSLYETLGPRSVVRINPFLDAGTGTLDARKAQNLMEVINDLIGTQVIDSRPILRKALTAYWSGNRSKLGPTLFQLPVSEKEALVLADQYQDKILRNQKINAWLAYAQEKYQTVVRLAKTK